MSNADMKTINKHFSRYNAKKGKDNKNKNA